ncbi:MAG: hypothetical protein QM758_08145 [Armatimonas sp.]
MASPSNPPRKRRPRRKSSPIFKQIFIGLFGIGVAMGLYRGAQAARAPYQLDNQQEVRITALQQRKARLTMRLADRTKLRNHLRTDEGREVIARQQGYHLPGEKVYLLRENTPESR